MTYMKAIITGFVISLLLTCHAGITQTITLTFSGLSNGQVVPVDKIKVENLDKGCDTTLFYPDSMLVLQVVGVEQLNWHPGGLMVYPNSPNPVTESTRIKIYNPVSQNISVVASDISSKPECFLEEHLERGYHYFDFTPGHGGACIISVSATGLSQSIKVTSVVQQAHGKPGLRYAGITAGENNMKSAMAGGFTFSPGDHLRFTGYRDISTTVIEDTPQGNMAYTFDFSSMGAPCPGIPTVTYGGQTYHTVLIGAQCWFRENLNIGTRIEGSLGQTNNGIIEKYCYINDEANCAIYGGLYQWNEMMQYVTTAGVKGICPSGWHVPTDAEWTTVTDFLGGWDVAGGKMKTTGTYEAGTGLWYDPNDGATNESGFSAVPSGLSDANGTFFGLGGYGFWWSSSESGTSDAWNRSMLHDIGSVDRGSNNKSNGFSVHCLRDF